MPTITIELSPAKYAALRKIAERERRSLRAQARVFVEAGINEQADAISAAAVTMEATCES